MYNRKITILYLITILIIISCTQKETTFYNEIEPIIHAKCAVCHNPKGAGPFDLITYQDINKRTKMIVEVITNNYMPPWPADRNYRSFVGEKSLTNEEKSDILNWIKNGAKAGENKNTRTTSLIEINQTKPKPDLVVKMSSPHITNGVNTDEFLMMKFPFELEQDTFIKKIEFVPDNKQIVHHVNAHLITYKNSGKQNIYNGEYIVNTEEFSDQEGFKKLELLNDNGSYPVLTPSVSNYLPGSESVDYPNNIGVLRAKKKNIILVNDFHYAPSPYKEEDDSYFNIYFSDKPPSRIIQETQLGTFGISKIDPPLIIPPNQIKTFTTKAMITQDISLLTINPHMHLIGKSFLAYAITLKNETIPLIKIDNWNFRWQYFYTFKKILKIPAGSEIIVKATYDNTENNPDNPFSPPKLITERKNLNGKGSMRTSDEMLQFIINYLPYEEGDENIELGL